MIKLDEDSLVCDLAETYQIYDYKQLPPLKVAVFSCGLRENSRIKLRINNQPLSLDSFLLAGIMDKLSLLLWTKTKDGQSGRNQPALITDILLQKETKKDDKAVFDSGEEFEKVRQKMLQGGGD
jgi:hypothetical protein